MSIYSEKSLEKKYDFVKRTTVGFLIHKDQICLGMKKIKYGKGKWNGAGGKVGDKEEFINETYEEGMVREMKEEFGVDVVKMEKVGEIVYEMEGNNDCTYSKIFFIFKWSGDPFESEEMDPKWFNLEDIPYENMWDGDKIWLPELLKGRKIKALFTFNK